MLLSLVRHKPRAGVAGRRRQARRAARHGREGAHLSLDVRRHMALLSLFSPLLLHPTREDRLYASSTEMGPPRKREKKRYHCGGSTISPASIRARPLSAPNAKFPMASKRGNWICQVLFAGGKLRRDGGKIFPLRYHGKREAEVKHDLEKLTRHRLSEDSAPGAPAKTDPTATDGPTDPSISWGDLSMCLPQHRSEGLNGFNVPPLSW